jgi:hypothetical protein
MRLADHSFRGVLPGVCVCLIVCDLETSKMRRPRPDLGCSATRRIISTDLWLHLSAIF